jgi:hypothetical protein
MHQWQPVADRLDLHHHDAALLDCRGAAVRPVLRRVISMGRLLEPGPTELLEASRNDRSLAPHGAHPSHDRLHERLFRQPAAGELADDAAGIERQDTVRQA